IAYGYLVGCVIVGALPLVYDSSATADGFLGQLVIATPALVFICWTIIAAKRRQAILKRRAERLADEQSALRRGATAVVGGEDRVQTYELAAREIATLLHGGAAAILRLDETSQTAPEGPAAIVAGAWADRHGGRFEPGAEVRVRRGSDVEEA